MSKAAQEPVGVWSDLSVIASDFEHAAAEAHAATNAEDLSSTLRHEVLQLLALVTSVLPSADWNSPFEPWARIGENRSFQPDDLTKPQLLLLARIAPLIEASSLRARVADIAWWYGNRGDKSLLALTVDTYLATPLESEVWLQCGRHQWQRLLEISRRRGNDGRQALRAMFDATHDAILDQSTPVGFFVIQISQFARSIKGAASEQEATSIADHLATLASESATGPAHRTTRALERESSRWYSLLDDREAALASQARVAEAYLAEAEERLAGSAGAIVADRFFEKAIGELRALPAAYRKAHSIDTRIAELNVRLAATREAALEQMVPIELDPVDITDSVATARTAVRDLSVLDALVGVAQILPLNDLDKLMAQEEDRFRGSLRSIFGSATYSRDARKVSTSDGQKADDEGFKKRLEVEAIRTFAMSVGFFVEARILPAAEQFSIDHRVGVTDMHNVCLGSPLVPPRHSWQWAQGLMHGLNGDFVSANALLVPQLEHMIRHHLKLRDTFTLHVGENHIEMEKSLNFLLERDEAVEVFGKNLVFTLRALLCEQSGPNVRNELAHGLLDDIAAYSRTGVYIWWICLKLAVSTYAAELEQDSLADNQEPSN